MMEESHLGLPFVLKEINFLLLVIALFLLLRKPVRDFFAARAAGLREKINASREAYRSAEADYRQITKRLENIDRETQDLLVSFKNEGEEEGRRMIAQARQFGEKIKADAQHIAASELRRVREELKEMTVATARDLAGKIIRQEMTGEDEKRLNEGFVKRLKGIN